MLRILRNSAGNTGIIFALASVPLIGVAGVAIDVNSRNSEIASLQAALDASVLAAIVAKSDFVDVAEKTFALNAAGTQTKGGKLTVVRVNNKQVDATYRATLKTSLTKVIGISDSELALHASAEFADSEGVCIMALAENASQAFLANNGARVNGADCSIDVKSTSAPAAILNAGTALHGRELCIAGNNIINNGASVTGLETGCTTPADPYAGALPTPPGASCDFNDNTYSGNVTLSPGVYCGWHNFNAGTNVTLNPGLYVIRSGGFNANGGQWTGNGVTFYFEDQSKIQFNSAVAATLKAPSSGPYAGIVFYEKSGLNPSQFIFNDNLGFNMEGIVYLPSREVVFNGGSSTQARKMSLVGRTIILNQTNWDITPFEGASSASVQARLVQ